MRALADTALSEHTKSTPPAKDRLNSQKAQWDLLSQGTGSIEGGTTGQRIADSLRQVQDGQTVDLEVNTLASKREINSVFLV